MNSPIENSFLEQLKSAHIVSDAAVIHLEHKGGTEAKVFEVLDGQQKVAVKIDNPDQNKRVVRFYETYDQITLLPKVLYVAPDFSFFAYGFLEGTRMDSSLQLSKFIPKIIEEVINKYQLREEEQWGIDLVPQTSFEQYLLSEVEVRSELSGEELGKKEEEGMKASISELFAQSTAKPYLTHGDLGAHNIIVSSGEMRGIIDPSIGGNLPIYELLYLFCSIPGELSVEKLIPYFEMLNDTSGIAKDQLPALLKIALYIRIGNCILHHPHDLEEYKRAYYSLPSL